MMRLYVTEEAEGDRIDRFLADRCEELSRSFLQKLFKSGEILVDGRPVKASYRVSEGEEAVFEVPEAVLPEIAAEDIPLDILYEDEDVIVVNKPKGMVGPSGRGPLYGDAGKRVDVSLPGGSFRNQRGSAPWNRSPDRYGHHRRDHRLQKRSGPCLHCGPVKGAYHHQTV